MTLSKRKDLNLPANYGPFWRVGAKVEKAKKDRDLQFQQLTTIHVMCKDKWARTVQENNRK